MKSYVLLVAMLFLSGNELIGGPKVIVPTNSIALREIEEKGVELDRRNTWKIDDLRKVETKTREMLFYQISGLDSAGWTVSDVVDLLGFLTREAYQEMEEGFVPFSISADTKILNKRFSMKTGDIRVHEVLEKICKENNLKIEVYGYQVFLEPLKEKEK